MPFSVNWQRVAALLDECFLYAFCLFVFMVFLKDPGTSDVKIWLDYIGVFNRSGLVHGYAVMGQELPPIGAALLWLIMKCSSLSGLAAFPILKLALTAAGMASVWIVHQWLRNFALSLGLFVLILFSMALGYLDVFYCPTILLSLRALAAGRFRTASVLYTIAFLTKWQPLIAAPFFVLYIVRSDWRAARHALLWSCLVAALVIIPFGYAVYVHFIYALRHSIVSALALNAGWLATAVIEYRDAGALPTGAYMMLTENHPILYWAYRVLFVSLYGSLLLRYMRIVPTYPATLLFATAGFLIYFTFNIGVHENHMFVACLLGLLASAFIPPLQFSAAILVGISSVNVVLFYGLNGKGLGFDRIDHGFDVSVALAFLSTAVCLWWWLSAMMYELQSFDIRRLAPGAIGKLISDR